VRVSARSFNDAASFGNCVVSAKDARKSMRHRANDTDRRNQSTGKQAAKAQRWSTGISLSLTSALDRVAGQRQASAALPPGKTRYPMYREQKTKLFGRGPDPLSPHKSNADWPVTEIVSSDVVRIGTTSLDTTRPSTTFYQLLLN
jgi:hypothetical protein